VARRALTAIHYGPTPPVPGRDGFGPTTAIDPALAARAVAGSQDYLGPLFGGPREEAVEEFWRGAGEAADLAAEMTRGIPAGP